jgi:dTDP-4-dehydrorhamnose reductase
MHYPIVSAVVVGASGLVGSALMRALGKSAIGTFRTRPAPGLVPLDARDGAALGKLVTKTDCEVVFFPAADPNVDWCETHPDEAYAANVAPALSGLEIARASGAGFVFFSSDYVFDGAEGPYEETASPAPLSVYGRQKLDVEERVVAAGGTVVRTTTVYGGEQPPGKNFVLRLVARLKANEPTTVPSDQYSTPTWSDELARGALAVAGRTGVWHVAGPDFLARDDFAWLIAEMFGLDTSLIQPVVTSQLRQKARRPERGGLRTEKIHRETGIEFLPTREALKRLVTAWP